jgi:Fur family ferric uptake transcriptional regulator
MAKEHDIFRNFLAEKRLKLTPQRRAILDVVFETHRHFDAEELVEIIRRKEKRISRATVYRTLDLLVKTGLVTAMELGEARKAYEHVVGHKHHDHLICTKCGRAIEFDDGFIELLQQKVCDRLNFEPQTHSLRIFGRCESCR